MRRFYRRRALPCHAASVRPGPAPEQARSARDSDPAITRTYSTSDHGQI